VLSLGDAVTATVISLDHARRQRRQRAVPIEIGSRSSPPGRQR
jgi:hypothetical protein